jgi:tripartite-type tricarboxylate transporter receptor subunit TctC
MGFRKLFLFLAVSVFSSVSFSQAYPNKPVHAIISFTPGSSTDIVGRVVMAKVSEYWGQPVIADNRAGAGGSIGTAVVARAAPDGYTLLIDSNAHSVTPSIYATLPYDTLKDFIDVVPFALQPNVLVVAANSRFKSVMDIVNEARAKPGAINFGSAGIGSGTHLNLERFIAAAKIKVTHIPYKGTPEVITNIMSGATDCYWAPISAALSSIKGGRLRALAVSSGKRNASLPDVPTTGEAGVSGADSPLWFGLWVAAGTPPEIVQKISADVRKALADPGVKDKLVNLGNDTMDMSPDDFAKFVREELNTYAAVIKAAGIKPQ